MSSKTRDTVIMIVFTIIGSLLGPVLIHPNPAHLVISLVSIIFITGAMGLLIGAFTIMLLHK